MTSFPEILFAATFGILISCSAYCLSGIVFREDKTAQRVTAICAFYSYYIVWRVGEIVERAS